ncbi:hypothetical protein [Streptomyces sp. ZEA17I]
MAWAGTGEDQEGLAAGLARWFGAPAPTG